MSHKKYYLTLKCGNHDASLWNFILPIWYMENPNMCAFSASDINLHLISILLFISSDFLWWHTVELHVWYIVQCLFPGLRQTAFVRFLHSGWQQCFQVDCCIQTPHLVYACLMHWWKAEPSMYQRKYNTNLQSGHRTLADMPFWKDGPIHQPYRKYLQSVAWPLTAAPVLAAADLQVLVFPVLQVPVHRIWWTTPQQELTRPWAHKEDHDDDEDELTISRVTFLKELFLGSLDRSIKLIHGDAIPVRRNVSVNVL